VEAENPQRLTASSLLDPLPRPLGPSGSRINHTCSLPEWFMSTLTSSNGGIQPRVSSVRSDKKELLPLWAQKNMITLVHVMPCYCAKSMSEGEMRIHKSNGTYVGVIQNPTKEEKNSENIVLLSCPHKTHRITQNLLPGTIKIVKKGLKSSTECEDAMDSVKETDFSQYHRDGILWIMIEGKEDMGAVMRRLHKGK
jgi:hypothetical protein